jgi:hypothetical protein
VSWIFIVQHNERKRSSILATLNNPKSSLHLHRDHFYPADLTVHDTGRTALKDPTSFNACPRFRSKREIAERKQDAIRIWDSLSSPPPSPTPKSNDAFLKEVCRKGFCGSRRLTLAQVTVILSDPFKYFSTPSSRAPSLTPQHGDVFLYDATKTPLYASDGLLWVQTGEEKLPHSGAVTSCLVYTSTAAAKPVLRYQYSLLRPQSDDDDDEPTAGGIELSTKMVLVHYYEDGYEHFGAATVAGSWLLTPPSLGDLMKALEDGHTLSIEGDLDTYTPPWERMRRLCYTDGTLIPKEDINAALAVTDLRNTHTSAAALERLRTIFARAGWSAEEVRGLLRVGPLMISDTWLRPRNNPALFFIILLALYRMDKTLDESNEKRARKVDELNERRAREGVDDKTEEGAGNGEEDDAEDEDDGDPETASFRSRSFDALTRTSKAYKEHEELCGRKTETSYRELEMKHLTRRSYEDFFSRCVGINGYSINAAALVLTESEEEFFDIIIVKIRRILARVVNLLQGDEGGQKVKRRSGAGARSAAAGVEAAAVTEEEAQREHQQGGADAAGLTGKSSESESDSSTEESKGEGEGVGADDNARQALLTELGALNKRGEKLADEIATLTSNADKFQCALKGLNSMHLRLCEGVAQVGIVHFGLFGNIAGKPPLILSETYKVLRDHRAAVDDVLKTAKKGGYHSVFVLNLPETAKGALGQRQAHRRSLSHIEKYRSRLDIEIARIERRDRRQSAIYEVRRVKEREGEEQRERAERSARPSARAATSAVTLATALHPTASLITLVREAKERYLTLLARCSDLRQIRGTDEAEVENIRTVERDVLLTLWHKVAEIALLQYDLQKIDADAKREVGDDNGKSLRLKAYAIRKQLWGLIRTQEEGAEGATRIGKRRMVEEFPLAPDNVFKVEASPQAIERRWNTLKAEYTTHIKDLRKYAARVEKDMATSEREDADVKKVRQEELEVDVLSLRPQQRRRIAREQQEKAVGEEVGRRREQGVARQGVARKGEMDDGAGQGKKRRVGAG